jgi:glycosyltransferase involved in cell wall biosynthesis
MNPAAPRVLVLGSVLGQPQGGVRRHNAELLPRAALRLAAAGGRLGVLGRCATLPFALPAPIECREAALLARPPAARALSEALAVRRVLRSDPDWDLVHTAHLPVPPLPLPYTLTLHDLRHLQQGARARRWLARRVIGTAVHGARRVIAVSAALREQLALEFGLARERIRVVPNAADHLPLLPRAPLPGAPILCVAHLEPRKNQALLLQALRDDPGLPELWLVGAAKGRERERLERLAREFGVAARVRFRGTPPDAELAEMYARCGCVVLPSTLEGYGLPVAEALRAGAPVAIARIPALLEVAAGAAESFDPHSAAECAAALRSALSRRVVCAAPRAGWDDSARLLCAAWAEALADGTMEPR